MARTLCTFPGRHGDIMWAMATVRAISETVGEPVDFWLSEETKSLLPFLQMQPYIDRAWSAGWGRGDLSKNEQIVPEKDYTKLYERVVHLHYRGWPKKRLAEEIWDIAAEQVPGLKGLELRRAWLSPGPTIEPMKDIVAVGFSEEHFELKYGIVKLLDQARKPALWPMGMEGGRWCREGGYLPYNWYEAAMLIDSADAYLGCLSALSVLAAGLGKRRVLVEPNEARWNPIFQHWDTPLVLGGDGRPTFHAPHIAEALGKVLESPA